MLISTITTIQGPTNCVEKLVAQLVESSAQLIVAGDAKGPPSFDAKNACWPVRFLSLQEQLESGFTLGNKLPTGHYSRKNIAYLEAIRSGASCVYETDDDNAPNSSWKVRGETVEAPRVVNLNSSRWVNVYKYFTDQNIWPRGLPLNEIHSQLPDVTSTKLPIRAPIQQGLVNGSPDVDAIWRLVMDRPFCFNDDKSIYLPPGAWCPFNTQSTWWWPVAYALMYIPSYCSFRMCDIWKSFVAQRCLWAMGFGVVFHAPEVDQDRNEHDLQRDFNDEVTGYENNRRIAEILDGVSLDDSHDAASQNLVVCYEALVRAELFPSRELKLIEAWIHDINEIGIRSNQSFDLPISAC